MTTLLPREPGAARAGGYVLALGSLLVVIGLISPRPGGRFWGRGIGSATGWYFLEPLIYANAPAFLWLGYYGWRIAAEAKRIQPREMEYATAQLGTR